MILTLLFYLAVIFTGVAIIAGIAEWLDHRAGDTDQTGETE
jgi:hypothetical protein